MVSAGQGRGLDAPNPSARPGPDPNAETRRFATTMDGLEAGAFVEATLEPLDGLFVVPGVRADVHRALANLSWVDPRLAVRWQLRPETAFKGAVGVYHQAPPFPYLTEEFGNPDLGEEGAWQYSVGAEQRILPRLLLDVQLYYKRLFDLALPIRRGDHEGRSARRGALPERRHGAVLRRGAAPALGSGRPLLRLDLLLALSRGARRVHRGRPARERGGRLRPAPQPRRGGQRRAARGLARSPPGSAPATRAETPTSPSAPPCTTRTPTGMGQS